MLKPESLQIGTISYTVKYVTQHEMHDREDCFGLHDESGTIIINTSYPPSRQKNTVLHEILHALSGRYGLGLEEKAIRGLANSLFEAMQRNPAAFDWIKVLDG